MERKRREREREEGKGRTLVDCCPRLRPHHDRNKVPRAKSFFLMCIQVHGKALNACFLRLHPALTFTIPSRFLEKDAGKLSVSGGPGYIYIDHFARLFFSCPNLSRIKWIVLATTDSEINSFGMMKTLGLRMPLSKCQSKLSRA